MGRSLEQQRAAFALKVIVQLEQQTPEWQSSYVSYVKGLPATIVMCGLGQAAATLLSQAKGRKESAHYELFANLQEWLCQRHPMAPLLADVDLMNGITNSDRNSYLHAQAEALYFLGWLKKFAVAYLIQQPSSEGGID